jgi:probable DNA repair protein
MPEAVSLFEVSGLLPLIEQGSLILTPNQRLASRIQTAYGLKQASDNAVIPSPNIASLEHWLNECWRDLVLQNQADAGRFILLGSQQELLLWEQIIRESEQGALLLRPAATAQQVASAYKQVKLWQVDLEAAGDEFERNEDSAVFTDWLQQFEQRCEQQSWLTPVQAQFRVLQMFEQGVLPRHDKIIGIGFESIAPLHKAILSAAGEFEHWVGSAEIAKTQMVCCESPTQELQAAAVWAKQQLRNDNSATVAVVVPELEQQRHVVQRVFQEVFEPETLLPSIARRALPFNLSAGIPLLETPLIETAFSWLSLCGQPQDTEELVGLLQSPFWSIADIEQENKLETISQLIQSVLNLRQFLVSHADLRYCAQKLLKETESPLSQQLQDQVAITRSENIKQVRKASEWRNVFVPLLKAVGWPGERQLDSLEYQQLMQWQQCLDQFAGLDEVVAELDFNEALSYLKILLLRQPFQPKTPDSRLQILGVLEAAGLQFDALWLMSMSDKQWPGAPAPNPFLPYSLQQHLAMPHASAERELDYARNLTQRFLSSANDVVVSYPKHINDSEAHISPLFSAFKQCELADILGRPLASLLPMVEIRRRHVESARVEIFDPGLAPQLKNDEQVRGGSSIFASQSACPFRAFSQHRLRLQPLPEAELGLTAADRGNLLHRALELLWQQLKNQGQLLALDDQQQLALCEQVVSYACTELQQRKPKQLGNHLKQLEQQRLQKLLTAWLSVERERSDFVVKHLEYQQSVRFADLEIKLRIDRIDQLSDGSWLLLDYKSGLPSVNRWWGDRPEEPQLPLYASLLQHQQQVGGIAFAQVRAEACVLKGVGDEALSEASLQWQDKLQNVAGVQGWQPLMAHWQKVLEALARDFIAGKAVVDPKQPSKTCSYCHLASVCRVEHQQEAEQ